MLISISSTFNNMFTLITSKCSAAPSIRKRC
jgi:hypothetical protein